MKIADGKCMNGNESSHAIVNVIYVYILGKVYRILNFLKQNNRKRIIFDMGKRMN